MSENEPTMEIARQPLLLERPDVISNDEIDRLFRIAKGLALSRVYKDVSQAEQAFAKLIVGHELGLNISQSMSIHFVEGQVTVPYPLLGLFVKAHGWSFDYLALTDDLAEIEFTDPDGRTFLSTFTIEDAIKARIVKRAPDGSLVTPAKGAVSMYEKHGRNMLVARAMSNGVRWYVQEATGGLPIYVHGEVVPERDELTAGGDGEPQGLDLGPKVDAVLERAAGLGHAGLADRATAEIALGNRSPAVAAEWVARATVTLDEFEAALPPDADVVEPSLGGGDASSADAIPGEDDARGTPRADAVMDPAAQEPVEQEAMDV